MSYTPAQIQQQNEVARQALASGKITPQQYQTFMNYQNQQLSQQTGNAYTTTPVYQSTHSVDNPLQKTASNPVGFITTEQTPQTIAPQPLPPSNPNSPLQQGIGGSNTDIFKLTSGLPGQQPVINTQEKATTALEVIGIVAAPVVAPALGVGSAISVLAGEGISVGVSQGFKAVQGGGLLTPQEALESAAIGGAFSVVGGGTNKALGLAGSGVKASLGRVGTSTLLGASGGTVLEFASTGKVTGQGATQGAVFGAAFGLVGEVSRPVISRVANKLLPNRVSAESYKVTRVTGASEIEKITVTDSSIQSQRLTGLRTETSKVPQNYGKFLKENQKFFLPDEVDVAGTEKVFMRGGGEYELYEKAYQSTREAEPYLNAAKGVNSLSAKGVMVDDTSGVRTIVTSSKSPGKVLTETSLYGKDVIGPEKILADRNLTGVKFYGDIDRQVYLKYLKNVPEGTSQDWLKQMGGLSYEQLTKPQAPSKVRVFTDVIGVEEPALKPISLTPTIGLSIVKPGQKQQQTSLASQGYRVPTAQGIVTYSKPKSSAMSAMLGFTGLTQSPDALAFENLQNQEHPVFSYQEPRISQAPVLTPSQPQGTLPSQTITTIPKIPSMFKPNQMFSFPDGKYEGGGSNMLLGFSGRGSRKARRRYPVTDPKTLARRML